MKNELKVDIGVKDILTNKIITINTNDLENFKRILHDKTGRYTFVF